MVRKVKPKKRASVTRERNAGTMSEAEFRSFIISWLRKLSIYWKPKNIAIARARIRRGVYKCELCWKEWPATLPPLPWRKRKRKNIQADHIKPAVPITWWIDYNNFIERLFVEADWYQAICWECHSGQNGKTKTENKERAEARAYKLKQKK